ncbi:hypothetical protein AURDEDRAFT_139233 [Auricularia subglabra TFB-10046 SS5]|uniref:Aminoglycoside phosphotransferase domain-containing protein n=1 Tax=Auricularia subglabra (strain TFB-10046 / SS5) TaxID=717982 RepID=J0WXA9_AURST|nr:hypothetical protein AURDEDRAFT_139233 [Auricularia subglabra TFB-10046 SS5]
MDNGAQVVARFPFACAGPRKLLIQSEAATLDFLGQHFDLPVPRVAAYSANTSNPVGVPYIITTPPQGQELTSDVVAKPGRFVNDLVQFQALLTSIPFSQHGSLYYASDVDQHLRDCPLFVEAEGFEPDEQTTSQFRIGPSVARNFYRGDRALLDINRGPWPDDISYFNAVVDCEIKWLQYCGSFDEARRSAWEPARSPQEHIDILEQWRELAPKLMLAKDAPRLWHPQMGFSEVRVHKADDGEHALAEIDGWQGACIAPLALQATFPNVVDPRILDSAIEETARLKKLAAGEAPAEEKEDDAPAELKQFVAGYLSLMNETAPVLVHMQLSDMLFIAREAHLDSTRSWEVGTFCLHYCLYRLAQEWESYPEKELLGPKIPVSREVDTPDEQSAGLWQLHLTMQANLNTAFLENGILGLNADGHVPPHQVEEAKKVAQTVFDQCLAAAPDEDERERIRHVWPLSEARYTACAESCE